MKVFLNRIVLLSVLVITTVMGCGKKNIFFGGEDDRLIIKNNSDKRLYACAQINFPDTSIGSYNPSVSKENYEVLPQSEKRLISHSWEQVVVSSGSDTLMLFIFDAQVLEKTPFATVKNQYLILKRYDLSLDDFQRMNWIINYP